MLPATLTQIENNAFDGCTSLKEIIIPEGMDPDGIGPWAFEGCTALNHVYLPDSIQTINSSAFYECSSLTSIHLPEDLTYIGMWAFASTGLISVEIPEGVDSLENCTFSDCSQLETVLIPDAVTHIDESAFSDCTSLRYVRCNIGSYAEKWALANGYTVLPLDMEIVDGVLIKYTGSASSLNIPASYGITAIGRKDGSGAFESNTSLRSITLPSGVATIGADAFRASNIETVRLSAGLKTIEGAAFMGCVRLTEINIPDGTGVGYRFSLAENRERNQKLKASLLAHHYGVTSIYGSWIEGIAGSNSREVAEESYFVVNLNDDPNFYENLFRLSEYFNQDSFLFKEKGSDTAVLVGTNMSGFPEYGKQTTAGQLTSLPSKFMSRIKKAAFSFVDKSNWVVKDKREDLTDADLQDYTHSYSWRNDKRPTFDQRKYDRMTDKEQKEIRLAEDWVHMKKNGGIVLETIDGQHPKQKDIIGKTAVK